MQTCKNCGAEFEGDYCTYCGVPVQNNTPAPTQQNTQSSGYSNAQGYQQAPYSQPVYNNYVMPDTKTTTVGGWFGWQLLESFLGIIGLIIMLCASNDPSVKNYAKARFIWTLIAGVIMVFFFVIIGVLAGSEYQ